MDECVFNYLVANRCGILTKKNCAHCPFRKTAEEYDRHEAEYIEMFNRLPDAKQRYYTEQYHCGKHPSMDDIKARRLVWSNADRVK